MDAKLIAAITRLPLTGLEPTPFLDGKEKYIGLKNKLKDKYDPTKDTDTFLLPLSMTALFSLPPRF